MSKSQLNGNLILSTTIPANAVTTTSVSTTTTSATGSGATSTANANKTLNGNSNNHHHHHNNSNNIKQQSSSASATLSGSKLQVPQNPIQQRRSLLPPAFSVAGGASASTSHTTQLPTTQLPSVTSGNATNNSNLTYPHQLQTVATIHNSQTQSPPHLQSSTTAPSTASTGTPANSSIPQQLHQQQHHATEATVNGSKSHTRRSLYHLQALKSTVNNLKAPAHSIPPRYQPPPQPQTQPPNSGILKHNLNAHSSVPTTTATSDRTVNGKLHPSYFGDTTTTNLNLKYPPDIPQLSTIYIPDSIKTQGGNSTRYHQQRHHHQQQQHQPQQQQQQQQQEMLKFVRKTDQDHPSPNASVTSSATGIPTATGRLTAEQNRQLQSLINELRALKDQNQRLLDDNQELRDLCCFLDDDRQKGRKLAREWQRFGRYTASVMRQEVAAYQNKLRQLDDKQQELITDNLELKELCLYLDEERAHVAANTLCTNCGASTRSTLRDDGDGSSSSTNADETITALRNYERQFPEMQLRTTLNDQTLQYVRSLERRIQQLEEERVTTTTPTANMLAVQQHQNQQTQQQQQPQTELQDTLPEPISGRPEAVVRALQVLEVREQLERDRLGRNISGNSGIGGGGLTLDHHHHHQMDDNEKALVREINVVWRKLHGGGSPNSANTLEPL